jgi:hypothetical protein
MVRAAVERARTKRRTVVNKQFKGALIATAVAGLFLTAHAARAADAPATGGEAAKVKCMGANDCKGKGSCGAADHSCAGQNSCKGKGWIMTSAADCQAKGGKVVK